MLDRIRLQNFKTHRDTEIQLGRLTVLVGPNGAGKSSVLQAIEMLGRLLDSPTHELLEPVITRARSDESIYHCAVTATGTFAEGDTWSKVFEVRRGVRKHVFDPDVGRLVPSKGSSSGDTHRVADEVAGTLLTPNPAQLAAPVPVSLVAPKMTSDGGGLADVLAKMQLEDADSFQALQGALRAVIPQIQRIGVKRVEIKPAATESMPYPAPQLGHGLVFDVSGRKGIRADQMSGGTLLVLGILALLYSPARPRILLLDDIDHGLHPRAQWDLLKQLRRLLEQFPDLQIVASSHSPDLVDELDPKEVIVMALREDGTSAAKPLTACPREDMLGVLRAGQLWSAVGEDWVKATDPEPATTEPAT